MKLKTQNQLPVLLLLVVSLTGVSQNCPVTISSGQSGVCMGFTATLTANGAASYTWAGSTITAPVVGPTLSVPAGAYTVTGATGTCVSSATIHIFQFPPLAISVNLSTQTTCIQSNLPKYSKPVVLTASGASTYLWTSDTIQGNIPSIGKVVTVRPPSSCCYTVTGSTGSCSGSVMVCLSVKPQFTFNVAPSTSSICLGDTVKLSLVNISSLAHGPLSAFSYTWTEPMANVFSLSSNLSSTVRAFPTSNAIYTVQIGDSLGCISRMNTATVSLLPCISGIKEMQWVQVLIYFINPYELRVQAENDGVMDLYDANGKLILQSQRIERGEQTLKLAEPVYGICMAGFLNNGHYSRHKIAGPLRP